MNYTRITINGVEYPLRFGMASFRYLASKDVNELDEIGVSHILYSGHYNHCLVTETIPSLKLADIVDYVESELQSGSNVLGEIMKVWSESQLIKGATEAKKKTTGKRSKS